MRLFLFLTCYFTILTCYSQDAYKKRYYVPSSTKYVEYVLDSGTGTYVKDTAIVVLEKQGGGDIDQALAAIFASKPKLKGNVAFGKDADANKVYVNLWLTKNPSGAYIARSQVYQFELQNRQSLNLSFKQWSLNALTVPIKVRFGDENEWSTGANLGALFGHTWGTTKFLHRTGIENQTFETKWTFGLFLGADKLEFTIESSVGDDDEKVKTGVISTGLGLTFSYQKFTGGLVAGIDSGVGPDRLEWDYHNNFFFGLGAGYSLFSF